MIKKLHWLKKEWCGNRLCYISLILGLEWKCGTVSLVWSGTLHAGACRNFSPTAEKILNFPFWVGKMLLGLNVLGFMAHPGLHSGSRLSYNTLYHLCVFFRNPEFSNAFAV